MVAILHEAMNRDGNYNQTNVGQKWLEIGREKKKHFLI